MGARSEGRIASCEVGLSFRRRNRSAGSRPERIAEGFPKPCVADVRRPVKLGDLCFPQMRHSKRSYGADWDEKDWEAAKWRSSSRKRARRSPSSARESKRCQYDPAKTSDSHYLESRSLNERDYYSRRYVDEYRNDYSQGCEPGHRHRDHEGRYQNHSSKSSGRSGRSSYKSKHRTHHSTTHRRSHAVGALSKRLEILFPLGARNFNLCLTI